MTASQTPKKDIIGIMVLNDSVHRLLETPVIVRMSVIDADGYPHTVPVWFGVDGDDLTIISEQTTRKNRLIQANPKGSISIGGDPADSEGYLFKGEFSIEVDPGKRWQREITSRYESSERTEELLEEWKDLDIRVLRFKIHNIVKV